MAQKRNGDEITARTRKQARKQAKARETWRAQMQVRRKATEQARRVAEELATQRGEFCIYDDPTTETLCPFYIPHTDTQCWLHRWQTASRAREPASEQAREWQVEKQARMQDRMQARKKAREQAIQTQEGKFCMYENMETQTVCEEIISYKKKYCLFHTLELSIGLGR